jgi:hypothetical protein
MELLQVRNTLLVFNEWLTRFYSVLAVIEWPSKGLSTVGHIAPYYSFCCSRLG